MIREIVESVELNEGKKDIVSQCVKQYLADLVEYDNTASEYITDWFQNGEEIMKQFRKENKIPEEMDDGEVMEDVLDYVYEGIQKAIKKI